METTGRQPPTFRVGKVLGSTLSVLFRNIVPFGILAIIFNAPLQFVPQLLGAIGLENVETNFIVSFAIGLASVLLAFLLSATLVYGTILELRGGRAGIVECMTRGLSLLLPVVGVGILVSIVIGAIALVFMVPGLLVPPILAFTVPLGVIGAIVAAVMLAVAIPVAVVERPGVFASLSRSVDLTKGSRWKVFGVFLVLLLINLVVGAVLSGFLGFGLLAAGAASLTLLTIVNLLVQAFVSALFAVATAVVYHDLRIVKEGASADDIAAVFE